MAGCQMKRDCGNAVTHIGERGYVYCSEHAPLRKGIERTRRMRPWEMALIAKGKPIPNYQRLPKPVAEVPA